MSEPIFLEPHHHADGRITQGILGPADAQGRRGAWQVLLRDTDEREAARRARMLDPLANARAAIMARYARPWTTWPPTKS